MWTGGIMHRSTHTSIRALGFRASAISMHDLQSIWVPARYLCTRLMLLHKLSRCWITQGGAPTYLSCHRINSELAAMNHLLLTLHPTAT
jgi:hypothetical protein